MTVVVGDSAHAEVADGPVVAGTGYTDISSLDVMGWEGDAHPTTSPEIHPKSQPRPRTDKIACGGRIDFYRVIKFGGGTTCFQKKGTLTLSSSIFPVEYVCPGNNAGQVWHYEGLGLGPWKWSVLRDGHANFNACWRFGRPTTTEVIQVRIK